MINSLKTPKLYVPIIILILAVIATSFWTYNNNKSKSNTTSQKSADTSVTESDFSMAKVIFPITGVSRNGNVITLTITENARGLEDQSQSVDISAMKKISAASPTKCPLVNSTSINKEIKDYNMISGEAVISATFATEDMAKAAADANCLLIRNTE